MTHVAKSFINTFSSTQKRLVLKNFICNRCLFPYSPLFKTLTSQKSCCNTIVFVNMLFFIAIHHKTEDRRLASILISPCLVYSNNQWLHNFPRSFQRSIFTQRRINPMGDLWPNIEPCVLALQRRHLTSAP